METQHELRLFDQDHVEIARFNKIQPEKPREFNIGGK